MNLASTRSKSIYVSCEKKYDRKGWGCIDVQDLACVQVLIDHRHYCFLVRFLLLAPLDLNLEFVFRNSMKDVINFLRCVYSTGLGIESGKSTNSGFCE